MVSLNLFIKYDAHFLPEANFTVHLLTVETEESMLPHFPNFPVPPYECSVRHPLALAESAVLTLPQSSHALALAPQTVQGLFCITEC